MKAKRIVSASVLAAAASLWMLPTWAANEVAEARYLCKGALVEDVDQNQGKVPVKLDADFKPLVRDGDDAMIPYAGANWRVDDGGKFLTTSSGHNALLKDTTCYATTTDNLRSRFVVSTRMLTDEEVAQRLRELAVVENIEDPARKANFLQGVVHPFCEQNVLKDRWKTPFKDAAAFAKFSQEFSLLNEDLWPQEFGKIIQGERARLSPTFSTEASPGDVVAALRESLKETSSDDSGTKIWKSMLQIWIGLERCSDANFISSDFEEISYAVMRARLEAIEALVDVGSKTGRPRISDAIGSQFGGGFLSYFAQEFKWDLVKRRIEDSRRQLEPFIPEHVFSSKGRMKIIRWRELDDQLLRCARRLEKVDAKWN